MQIISKLRREIYLVLRASEKYTKTDMVYLAKGGFWLTLMQVISYIFSFFIIIAFANLLPKEIYGNYQYILSLVGTLSALSLNGMGMALLITTVRGFEGVLRSAFIISLKYNVVLFIISFIISFYYYTNNNYMTSISLIVVGILSPLLNSAKLYDYYLTGKKYFRKSAIYSILNIIISSILILLTLFLTNNLLIIIIVYFLSNTLMAMIFYLLTLRLHNEYNKIDPITINYAKHLSIINVISIISTYLDKLVIFYFLGPANLAIYYFSIAVPDKIRELILNIRILAIPKFAQRSIKDLKRQMFIKMLKLGSIILIIIVVYIITAPLIYKLFFNEYIDSLFYSQIFALSLIFSVGIIPNAIIHSRTLHKELYLYNISILIFNILILIPLIYFYGIIGAIISRILYKIMILLISIILVIRLKQ